MTEKPSSSSSGGRTYASSASNKKNILKNMMLIVGTAAVTTVIVMNTPCRDVFSSDDSPIYFIGGGDKTPKKAAQSPPADKKHPQEEDIAPMKKKKSINLNQFETPPEAVAAVSGKKRTLGYSSVVEGNTTGALTIPPASYYYDCQEYTAGDETKATQWSLDNWRGQYCKRLNDGVAALMATNQKQPPLELTADGRRGILFVTVQEECERYREFLLDVRTSGYTGHIVMMTFYDEDVERCGAFKKEFGPLEVRFFRAPRWEITLMAYHGVTSYFRQEPTAVKSYDIAAVVRPEFVDWCGNPFADMPAFPTDKKNKYNKTIFATLRPDPRKLTILWDVHNSNSGKPIPADDFMIGSPMGLKTLMELVMKNSVPQTRDRADPTWSYFQSVPRIVAYRNRHLRTFGAIDTALEPFYEEKSCTQRRCKGGQRGVQTRNEFCYKTTKEAQGTIHAGDPQHSPFCYIPYRHAISEAPRDGSVTLNWVADRGVHEAIYAIKTATTNSPNDIYSNPSAAEAKEKHDSKEWGGYSDECPNGRLAILSMMGKYPLSKVDFFLGSYLKYTDPKCTRLVIILKWFDDVKQSQSWKSGTAAIAAANPTRMEMLYYAEDEDSVKEAKSLMGIPEDKDSNHDNPEMTAEEKAKTPKITVLQIHSYVGRVYVEQRFELGRDWLELNYKDYRYVQNIDSRDLVFLGDPLKQIVKNLKESKPVDGSAPDYLHDEFVGSIAEAYPLGSFSTLNEWVTKCAIDWLTPCGPRCAQYLMRQTFTNGEPFAVINSGNVVGTPIALMQFYRLYIRLTIESKYQFTHSDQGTFTFGFYGAAPDTNFPHRLLAFHTSRAGFANPPHFNRLTRRKLSDSEPKTHSGYEYNIKDCAGNHVAIGHQADRVEAVEELIRQYQAEAPKK